jgi:hypothetical protein
LGSSAYLKEKFSMGYTLETKIDLNQKNEALDFIQNIFNQKAKLAESFSNRFVLSIPKDCIKSLARVFQSLEKGIFKDAFLNQFKFLLI